MIAVEEATHLILDQIHPLGRERLNILQSLGRVLGEDIIARRHIPPWDNSAMDGYAVRWQDIQKASSKKGVKLTVLADLPAGRIFTGEIGPGQAVRIMTGAPLPRGADTVAQVEETKKLGDTVRIFAHPERGKNIRRAGEDVKAGERVLEEGTVLRPAHIGLLASLQRSIVSVYQVPRVAILSTGDELLEIDEPWEEGKIVNSNSYSLTAQVLDCGALPSQLGIARDRAGDLAAKIQQGLAADILVNSGGFSVGDYDLVKGMLKDLGKMNFWKVAMRPGQPLAFGRVFGKPVFGLPGNPVSSMVSFEQFVRPALRVMEGRRALRKQTLRVALEEDVENTSGRRHYIRAVVTGQNGNFSARTTGEQGSGILTSMVSANALLVIPEDVSLARRGEVVTAQMLDWPEVE